MAEIVWTERARQDLKEIVEYISRDSKAYAQSFALRLRTKVERLSKFPKSGRFVPEDSTRRVREVIVENYRILYGFSREQVAILTIVQGARKID